MCALHAIAFLMWVRSMLGFASPRLKINARNSCRSCVSFAGGGFLCLYELGAARVLMHRPELHGCAVTGSSIGGWLAAAFLYLQGLSTYEEREAEWQRIVEEVLAFSEANRKGWLSKRLRFIGESSRSFLRSVLAKPGVLEASQERLHIPVSVASLSPPRFSLQVWNSFRDTKHLEEVLVAGSSIPGCQDWPPRRVPENLSGIPSHGVAFDAGTFDNCPRLIHGETLRISWIRFSSADIRPSRFFSPARFARPPDRAELTELLDEGFKDATAWVTQSYSDTNGSHDNVFSKYDRYQEPQFEDEATTAGSLKLEAHEEQRMERRQSTCSNSDTSSVDAEAKKARMEHAKLLNEKLQLQNRDLMQQNACLKLQLAQRSHLMNAWPPMHMDPRCWPMMNVWPPVPYSPSHGEASPHSPLSLSSLTSFGDVSKESSTEAAVPATFTTVMMRNIPNNYSREMLFQLLNDKGFKTKYDLVYLPLDFKKKVGLGYAFINFVDHDEAERFKETFKGFNGWVAQSEKVCEVTWSDALQGRDLNIARYRNSPIMHEAVPDGCKPVLFGKDGERISFPPPTKRIRAPREWQSE